MVQGGNVASLHGSADARWDKLVPIMPTLKTGGLKRIRCDSAYTAIFAASGEVTDVSTVTTYHQKMAAVCGSLGIEVYVVVYLTCENRAAWRNTWNGGVAWDSWMRPPIGVGGGLARASGRTGARYANAMKAAYVAAGGNPKNFHVLICNELYVGGAGFPNGAGHRNWAEDIEENSDNFYTGYWDTTFHWSHTFAQGGWSDLLSQPPTQPVTGIHDWLEVAIPEFMAYLDADITCHFPSFGNENLANELATFMPNGYTWYEHPRLKTNGKYNLTLNAYRGYLAGVRTNSISKLADELVSTAVTARANIAAHMGGMDKFNLLYTEWGTTMDWLIGDSTARRNDEWLRGRVLDWTATELDSLGFVNFLFTIQGWDASVDPFALLKSDDSFTAAIRPMLIAGGHTATTAPDGSSYNYGTSVGEGGHQTQSGSSL